MHRKATRYLGKFSYAAFIAITLSLGAVPAALNYFVDPYEYFRTGHHGKKRNEATEKKHYPLWKFAHYKRDAEIVVLGDSRARALRDKYWREFEAAPTFNFAYGGGTIPEVHSTFRAIKDDPHLKTLVVGIQLRSFDERHKGGMNRVPEAQRATEGTTNYLKNWFVTRRAWSLFEEDNPDFVRIVKSLTPQFATKALASNLGEPGSAAVDTLLLPEVCYGCDLPDGGEAIEPPVKKGPNLGLGRGRLTTTGIPQRKLPKVFERQITKNASSDWKNFRFSERYFRMIEEVADWADAQPDRELIFVIPPTILEMQQSIQRFGLDRLDQRFRERLRTLAPVIDLDFPNKLTRDPRNFSDAYHFNSKVARSIVGEVMRVKGVSKTQANLIAKKRPKLTCPKRGPSVDGERSSDFLEGKSCRLWVQKENG